jgi:small-conductance mechanosensitive channel
VGYGTDIEALRPRLQAAVAAVDRVMTEPGPAILLSNFAPDGLELTVGFWIADPERGLTNVRSDVNLAILGLLRASKVEIPYPQRVLHHTAEHRVASAQADPS